MPGAPHTTLVIRRFRHRGLKRLYERGDVSQIRPDLLPRVQDILGRLDVAEAPEDLDMPGYRLHRLRGDLKAFWSVTVSRNWRLIFRFEGSDATDIDFIDYH